MPKSKPVRFDPSQVPQKIFFDFVIDYHEDMCYSFSCQGSYRYTKLYPRVSYEDSQKYFHNKIGTDFSSLMKLAEKTKGFDEYFKKNYTRYAY